MIKPGMTARVLADYLPAFFKGGMQHIRIGAGVTVGLNDSQIKKKPPWRRLF